MFPFMADTTILIRNPDVVADIHKLAERTGKPAAEAVADAVHAQLGQKPPLQAPHPLDRRNITEAAAAFRALPHDGAPLTDADLYDEHGLPR
jgi:hypothetical protein